MRLTIGSVVRFSLEYVTSFPSRRSARDVISSIVISSDGEADVDTAIVAWTDPGIGRLVALKNLRLESEESKFEGNL